MSLKLSNEELQLRLEYNDLKANFLGNISHELRTPLNVILGTIQLLELQNNNINKDEKITKHLKIMKQNCYRLLKLSNNIIDLTSIDSGLYETNMDNHDIVSIVGDATLFIVEYIKKHDKTIEFVTDIKEKIIVCDQDKIEKILFNLLSNAIKCTKAGEKITVILQEEKENILLIVKDNGRGIPEEKQKNIFNRFKLGENLLTRSHEGSGLGLALTKSLVEMHGGRISLKSEWGVGSEFIVEIPVLPLIEEETSSHLRQRKLKTSLLEKTSIEFSDINYN